MRDVKVIWGLVVILLLCSVVSLAAGLILVRSARQSRSGRDNPLVKLIRPLVSDDEAAAPEVGDEGGSSDENSSDNSGEGSVEEGSGPGPATPATGPTAAPDPTPDIPPEICDSDPCTLPVIVPPVEDLGDGDCSRYTEADVLTPILFEVPREAVTAYTPEGDLHVSGTISFETPVTAITLGSVELTYERYNPGLGGFERVSGRGEVPTNIMEMAGFGGPVEPAVVELLLARGKDLDHLEAPLCPGRQYITLTIEKEAGLEVEDSLENSVSYEIRGGATIIVDPLDPMYQLHGEIPMVGKAGAGRSFLGLIPYSPANDWGIADKVFPFTGHSYQYVEDMELAERFGIPLEVTGIMAVDADPENNNPVNLEDLSLTLGSADGILDLLDELIRQNADHAVGHSGGLSVGLPIPGELDIQLAGEQLFDFDLVDGSTGIYLTGGESQAYFSGFSEQEPIFPILLLQPIGSLRTAGFISDKLSDFEIRQEGQYDLEPHVLAQALPIELAPLRIEGASIANINGTHFQGTALSQIHPDILFEGQVGVEAHSDFRAPANSFMTMSGELSMPAFGLSGDSQLTVNASGLTVAGAYEIDPGRIVQEGNVSLGNLLVEGILRPVSGGYQVSGLTSSQIHPLVSAGGQLQVEAFLAADPLASSLTISGDMQVAGVSLANAQMAVGPSGVQIEGGYSTPLNSFRLAGGLTDAGPNLTGSTEVSLPLGSKSGSISGWEIENQCIPNAEIKSCTIKTFLGSIDGIKHAVTANICIPFPSGGFDDCKISTPAVSLGELNGEVTLQLGVEGLGGSFDASVCPASGACQSLLGGRLMLAAEPQACVTVPVAGEDVCIPF